MLRFNLFWILKTWSCERLLFSDSLSPIFRTLTLVGLPLEFLKTLSLFGDFLILNELVSRSSVSFPAKRTRFLSFISFVQWCGFPRWIDDKHFEHTWRVFDVERSWFGLGVCSFFYRFTQRIGSGNRTNATHVSGVRLSSRNCWLILTIIM